VVDTELLDKEMWSLNEDEAVTVKKRVDTLRATLTKRKQQRADVREVFASSTQVGRVCFLATTGRLSILLSRTGTPVVGVCFLAMQVGQLCFLLQMKNADAVTYALKIFFAPSVVNVPWPHLIIIRRRIRKFILCTWS